MKRRIALVVLVALAAAGLLLVAWLGLRAPQAPGSMASVGAGRSQEARAATPFAAMAAADRQTLRPLRDTALDQATPEGKARDVIAALAPLAEHGDAVAARRLYLKLLECKQARDEPLRYDDDPATVSPELVRKSGLSKAQLLAQSERNRLQSVERTLAECEGVTDAQYAAMRTWLTRAAMAGDLTARMLYALDSDTILGSRSDMLRDPQATIDYKRNVLGFMHDAADAGVPEAMQNLGLYYGNGIMAPRDPVLSYAYYELANRVSPDPFGAELLSNRARSLSASQLVEAHARADALHARCCER